MPVRWSATVTVVCAPPLVSFATTPLSVPALPFSELMDVTETPAAACAAGASASSAATDAPAAYVKPFIGLTPSLRREFAARVSRRPGAVNRAAVEWDQRR